MEDFCLWLTVDTVSNHLVQNNDALCSHGATSANVATLSCDFDNPECEI